MRQLPVVGPGKRVGLALLSRTGLAVFMCEGLVESSSPEETVVVPISGKTRMVVRGRQATVRKEDKQDTFLVLGFAELTDKYTMSDLRLSVFEP